ncbi:MAG: tRNA (adenosine(37)-N6)-threonylcarbamoyltransferase complex ATPase subunit type 1 TsaE [Planctomycetes bacterium]|nr:tRNA (adenosine(37)-N6)-threonylcarbamoyltransferase complex ATPase subunit type 1 TsaE [Planctomycetota bacterium]
MVRPRDAVARWPASSSSPAETVEIARRLGSRLEGGETIALEGDLGAGKTTFTRGLCEGLGLEDMRLVSSPTYVLEHIYPARLPVHHYDAYRLASAAELAALGFQERIAAGAVLVIEWADKVAEVLPEERLRVELSFPEGEPPGLRRLLVFSGLRRVWGARLEALAGARA